MTERDSTRGRYVDRMGKGGNELKIMTRRDCEGRE